MEDYEKENVAKFFNWLSHQPPINEGWTETRRAFRVGGQVYLIQGNFPHWRESAIEHWLKIAGIPAFDVEVTVTPNLKER